MIFIVCVLWRVHKEKEYVFLVCILAAISITFVWTYGTVITEIHTPMVFCNVFAVIISTYDILMHAKGELCTQKYTILWILMLLLNMFTLFLLVEQKSFA